MENGGLQVEGQDKVGRVGLLPFRENGPVTFARIVSSLPDCVVDFMTI